MPRRLASVRSFAQYSPRQSEQGPRNESGPG